MIVLSRRVDAGQTRPIDQPAADKDWSDLSGLQIWSATLFGLTYFAFLVACGAGLAWQSEPRHMAPIYPVCHGA